MSNAIRELEQDLAEIASQHSALPVEEEDEHTYFCSDCGEKCVINKSLENFDSYSGEPEYSVYATCPNVPKTWFKRILSTHTRNHPIDGPAASREHSFYY